MHTFVTIIHVLACIILILVVLLQAGKGANMGAAFGGSSQTVFGSSGAGTFLGKMTAVIAIIFMLTSLVLTYSVSHKGSSLFDSAVPITKQETPKTPDQNAANPSVPAAPGK
ncbi:MAG TPA: preprotein translocase subunit SecG [Smithellaceae bacterium]|nr:preprotein translocase subunit SecG [Smithellaceae bacterium]